MPSVPSQSTLKQSGSYNKHILTQIQENCRNFIGSPVNPLEEASEFKVESSRMVVEAVDDGGRLHQQPVAGLQEGSSTVCLGNAAPVQDF